MTNDLIERLNMIVAELQGLPHVVQTCREAAAHAEFAARAEERHSEERAAWAALTEALAAERDEAFRRRDAWRAKAEGYDEIRLALREKVGSPWPPNLSRALWAGIAADEKKRADDAEAKCEALAERVRELEEDPPEISPDAIGMILKRYIPLINATPELLSLLYDADMLPEQATRARHAIMIAAVCEAYKAGTQARKDKEEKGDG
jgi:hypothetical protein